MIKYVEKFDPAENGYCGYVHVYLLHRDFVKLLDWCLDNFGIDGAGNWWFRNSRFYFTKEEDLLLFVLRFS